MLYSYQIKKLTVIPFFLKIRVTEPGKPLPCPYNISAYPVLRGKLYGSSEKFRLNADFNLTHQLFEVPFSAE